MKSCAFHPCVEVAHCPLPGGCVQKRFPVLARNASTKEQEKPKQQALNGVKPSRFSRRR